MKCFIVKLSLTILLSFISSNLMAVSNNTLLVLDNENYTDYPKNYRSPQDFKSKEIPTQFKDHLEDLNFSASGQFSEPTLLKALHTIQASDIWIVDLRLESHGFLDGQPVSWYGYRNQNNKGLTKEVLLKKEADKIASLKHKNTLKVGVIKKKVGGEIKDYDTLILRPKKFETESALVERLGLHYLRLPVLDRHPPLDNVVDTYVEFILNLPEDSWIYLHCRAGKGRATTLAVLYDIIKNGNTLALSTILQRQAYFGSKDLSKMPTKPGSLWKLAPAKARLKMIEDFYQYRQSKEFPNTKWSEWQKQQSAHPDVGIIQS